MKAIQCKDFGPVDQLSFEEVPDPNPAEHEVIIEPHSIGVNFPDALLVQGLYQVKPPTPFTPGMELAGVIKSVGSKVTKLSVGDHVAGICQMGAWAELVLCNESTVMKIPPQANKDEVVALLCGYGTAHHALKQRANLQPGETVLVTGASGLTGLAAVQIAKAMGARVLAAASTPDKQKLALDNGADIAFGYDDLKEDLKKETSGKGVDVVFEVVGGDVFDICSRAMAWEGRLLIVGFASGQIPKLPVNLALVKGYSATGVFWGSFTMKQPELYAENMQELMSWYQSGKVKPHIGKTYPLKDVASALQYILDRKASGKIVLNP